MSTWSINLMLKMKRRRYVDNNNIIDVDHSISFPKKINASQASFVSLHPDTISQVSLERSDEHRSYDLWHVAAIILLCGWVVLALPFDKDHMDYPLHVRRFKSTRCDLLRCQPFIQRCLHQTRAIRRSSWACVTWGNELGNTLWLVEASSVSTLKNGPVTFARGCPILSCHGCVPQFSRASSNTFQWPRQIGDRQSHWPSGGGHWLVTVRLSYSRPMLCALWGLSKGYFLPEFQRDWRTPTAGE